MLVLSREENQRIVVGNGEVIITVVRIGRDKVKLGIEAKADTSIHREEVYNRIQQQKELSGEKTD